MPALRRMAAPLLLGAATLATWAGVLGVPFQYDDHDLLDDEATRDLGALRAQPGLGVRPHLKLTYVLDHALWGGAPAGYHATNLLLHLATVLGVWVLARRRLGGAPAALAAAAVFALQPADAEVVAYVAGRSTGLMTALLV